jgi:mRNA interferase YafQ
MAYTVSITSTFKKDFKRCMKRGLDMSLITKAMDLLEETGTLPPEY